MGLRADWKYEGVVGPNSQLITTQTGSLGYQVNLIYDGGETSFTIWLTEKNRKRAAQYFDVLGVPAEKLKSRSYFDLQLGLDIEGREVVFGTKEETYNNKTSIKVAWIGKKAAEDPAAAAAAFFSGDTPAPTVPTAPAKTPADGNGEDEQIPF